MLLAAGCGRSETTIVVPEAAPTDTPPVTGVRPDTLIFDDEADPDAPVASDDGMFTPLPGEPMLPSAPGAPGAPAAPGQPATPGTPVAAEPFEAFLNRFKAAVRARDREALAAMVVFSDNLTRDEFDTYFEPIFAGPFAARMLALTPRDFVRQGDARTITVRAGFDADGNPVPEDEAVSESSARLRFLPGPDGRYRLVDLDVAQT